MRHFHMIQTIKAVTPEASPTSTEASSTTTEIPGCFRDWETESYCWKSGRFTNQIRRKQLRPKEVVRIPGMISWSGNQKTRDDDIAIKRPTCESFPWKQLMNKPTLEGRSKRCQTWTLKPWSCVCLAGKSGAHALITGNIWIPQVFGSWFHQQMWSMCCPIWMGFLFTEHSLYNWPSSIKDQEHFRTWKKIEGSKTFLTPVN